MMYMCTICGKRFKGLDEAPGCDICKLNTAIMRIVEMIRSTVKPSEDEAL